MDKEIIREYEDFIKAFPSKSFRDFLVVAREPPQANAYNVVEFKLTKILMLLDNYIEIVNTNDENTRWEINPEGIKRIKEVLLE